MTGDRRGVGWPPPGSAHNSCEIPPPPPSLRPPGRGTGVAAGRITKMETKKSKKSGQAAGRAQYAPWRLSSKYAPTTTQKWLPRRGSSAVPSGEQCGKWKVLRESTDREIVWPPMVIIVKTLQEEDEVDKWKCMENPELLDDFSEFALVEARHAYFPHIHCGIGVLIFESSAMGYMEAERLHRYLFYQRKHREARKHGSVKGQLLSFLAQSKAIDNYNRHCDAKGRLKYKVESYNEMVVVQMKQMRQDILRLNFLKNKIVKTEQHCKVLEETLGFATQKLEVTMEDSLFLRLKSKEKYLEYDEELKSLEKFFHDQIECVHKAIEEKESELEKLLQKDLASARLSVVDSGTTKICGLRKEQVKQFIDCPGKDLEEFKAEREELIKAHTEKKVALKKEYIAKDTELDKDLEASLTGLMEKRKPDSFHVSNSLIRMTNYVYSQLRTIFKMLWPSA